MEQNKKGKSSFTLLVCVMRSMTKDHENTTTENGNDDKNHYFPNEIFGSKPILNDEDVILLSIKEQNRT